MSFLTDFDVDSPLSIINEVNSIFTFTSDGNVYSSLRGVHSLIVISNLKVAIFDSCHVKVEVLIVGKWLVHSILRIAIVEEVALLD